MIPWLHTADLRKAVPDLRAGKRVLLSGPVYTARDAVHKRLVEMLNAGKKLPFPLQDAVIYYSGSTPAPFGKPIGSCGPTTSCRMDPYTPQLYREGLCATIGKGDRSPEVAQALVETGGVYFCALGGAGALAAKRISGCQVIAFPELGCEAVRRLMFDSFPLIVGMDCHGGSIFDRKDDATWLN